MPAVKKLKPINFIVQRDLVISALAVYFSELQHYKIANKSNLKISESLEFKNLFHQKFKVDYYDVIKNSIQLLVDIREERIDISQKDTTKLIKIYDEFIHLLKKSDNQPIKLIGKALIGSITNGNVILKHTSSDGDEWLYKGFAYEIQGHYSEDEIRLLILEDFDKERRRFEKLRAKFDDVTSKDLNYERSRIPEKVRIEIWRRDGGKCARCGSRERL